MKKRLFTLGFFFSIAFASYHLFFFLDEKKEKKEVKKHQNEQRLSAFDIEKLKEGDFILRRGYGFFSDMIAKHLNTGHIDLTHAGILVKRDHKWFVIHSLSSDVSAIDGVQMQVLDTFLSHSQQNKIIVSRFKNITSNQGKEIVALAQKYLDDKIPFDHQGNYDDASKMFCTEMIWKILEKDLKWATLPHNPEARKSFFYSMKPMYDENYFELVVSKY
jgi:hypothetical protein